MRIITKEEFLEWAATKGLHLDPQYPKSAVLNFREESGSRFWEVPPEPECRPHFLALLFDLLEDWQTCYVWRNLGNWPDPAHQDPRRAGDAVELQILKGLGVPLGSAAVLGFGRGERDTLLTLLFSTTVFACSQPDDLYIAPDHARQVIRTDHHDVVHVSFSAENYLQHWVSKMSEEGYDLPGDLPDWTFKRPSWMGGGED